MALKLWHRSKVFGIHEQILKETEDQKKDLCCRIELQGDVLLARQSLSLQREK